MDGWVDERAEGRGRDIDMIATRCCSLEDAAGCDDAAMMNARCNYSISGNLKERIFFEEKEEQRKAPISLRFFIMMFNEIPGLVLVQGLLPLVLSRFQSLHR